MTEEKTIGNRIKDRRNKLKLSQKNVAVMLNTSHQYISDIERGKYMISVPNLLNIIKILKIKNLKKFLTLD